jgi:hypothetical protein
MPDKYELFLDKNKKVKLSADEQGNFFAEANDKKIKLGASGLENVDENGVASPVGADLTALSQSIIPDTNEVYDLGSAEKKFRHLYLSSNSLFVGDTKITSDPTTGALTTAVSDGQGGFADPAPVGGSAGSYDWEATGFTHFSPFLTTNYPSGYDFEKISQMGTDTKFLDPIALWNHTRGANPILRPDQHINGSKWGTANSSDFNPAAAQNFRWAELSILNDTNPDPIFWQYGPNIAEHGFWLTSPDEFDVHRSGHQYPATLFKDANNEYFKDFLSKKMDEHNLMDLTVQLECDVVYTCSDAATAAATPFFQDLDAESDGVYRRVFTSWRFPEMLIRRYSRLQGRPNADYNDFSGREFPNSITASENYIIDQVANSGLFNISGMWDVDYYDRYLRAFGSTGGYMLGDNFQSVSIADQALTYESYPAIQSSGKGAPSKRQAYGNAYFDNMRNRSLAQAYWGIVEVNWSGDFFEGGIVNHSDYTQGQATTYENAGRGCEINLRVKIK